jgi:hypothetical protein
MDRLTRSRGSLFREQSSLYRTHTQLMLDSENRKGAAGDRMAERKRSELAQEALQALKKAKKARTYATLRDGAISALERLLVALAVIGAVYGVLVFASEAVCIYRGVC